jgi:aminoglycoside phosphotransferase (APT) family kinase protein
MRPLPPPAVPYDATAERPDWSQLPAAVREAIADRLGAPVVGARTAGGGFTRGFAAVLTTAGGDRAFVKAATLPDQQHLADWYAHEMAIAAALPADVRAPRPRWALHAGDHFVICLDAVDGRMPRLPWDPAELTAALDTWAVAAAALRPPPPELLALGLPRLADLLRADLTCWSQIAAGRLPMPEPATTAAAHLSELVALEAALPGYVDTPTLTHCDLRLDNVLIDRGGRAWLCDWNWLCVGAPWFDTAMLLVSAYASGLDADALFHAHPTAEDAPRDALDATLAALSGHHLCRAAGPPSEASPHLRAHQLWAGTATLSWLTTRRRWRDPSSPIKDLPTWFDL